MPLWLDLLRTPMAAPETTSLKKMRRTWQGLCIALAISVLAIGPLSRCAPKLTPIVIATLLLVTLLYSATYWIVKQKADTAYLDDKTGEGE